MGKSMVSGSDFPQQTNPLRGPMEQSHKDPCPEGLRSSLEFTRVHSSSLHTRFSVPNDNVKAHIGEESHQTWERAESILECCASIYQPFSCKRRFFFGGETKIKNQNMVDIYIFSHYIPIWLVSVGVLSRYISLYHNVWCVPHSPTTSPGRTCQKRADIFSSLIPVRRENPKPPTVAIRPAIQKRLA